MDPITPSALASQGHARLRRTSRRKTEKLEKGKWNDDPVGPTLAALKASQFGRPLRFPLVAENKIARTAEPK
jgi:hypothetical protein